MVSDEDLVVKKKSDTDSEGDSDEESGDDEFDPEMLGDDLNFPALINHFFTNEDGQNIADIITDLKKSIDTQNKLIYKMLSAKSEKTQKK
jgi:hypothetical protein